jgi:hypothetical protein
MMKPMIWGVLFLIGTFGRVWAQDTSLDELLPADHLLEDIPWLDDEGKVEIKGLFTFENIRSVDSKDLIMVYRQATAVGDMDQPHSQTLAICFYNPTQKKYEKAFLDEGGAIQWMRTITDSASKKEFLVVERSDLNGHQVLKAYAYLNDDIQPVLAAQAAQIFADFPSDAAGAEILCSSRSAPQKVEDAEHVYTWNDKKSIFVDAPSSTASDWTVGATPTVEAVAQAMPTASSEAPSVPATVAAAVSTVPSAKSSAGWWSEPIQPESDLAQLENQMVPDAVRSGQIAPLGKKANAFFAAARSQGITGSALAKMRAGYYAAVASAVAGSKDPKDAGYYLNLALKLDPTNAQAVALKSQIKP